MRIALKMGTLVILGVLFVGCDSGGGGGGQTERSSDQPFLGDGDFSLTGVTELKAQDLTSALNEVSAFQPGSLSQESGELSKNSSASGAEASKYIATLLASKTQFILNADESTASSGDGALEKCLGERMANLVYVMRNDALSFNIDFNVVRDCPEVAAKVSKETGGQASFGIVLKLYSETACSGVDLAPLAGTKVSDTPAALCQGASDMQMQVHSMVDFFVKQDANNEMYMRTNTRLTGAAADNRCVVSKIGTGAQAKYRVNQCEFADRSEFFLHSQDQDSEMHIGPKVFVSRVSLKNLDFDMGDTFYAKGDASFSLNGWDGAVHFTGADENPSWEAKKATDHASGILTSQRQAPTPKKSDTGANAPGQ